MNVEVQFTAFRVQWHIKVQSTKVTLVAGVAVLLSAHRGQYNNSERITHALQALVLSLLTVLSSAASRYATVFWSQTFFWEVMYTQLNDALYFTSKMKPMMPSSSKTYEAQVLLKCWQYAVSSQAPTSIDTGSSQLVRSQPVTNVTRQTYSF